MKTSSWTPLMHAVLDGEATPEETATLNAQVVADPDTRAAFAQLEALFGRLAAVPMQHPPEGLVATVSAAIREYSRTDQPIRRAGVIGSTARDFGTYSNPPPADSNHSFTFSIIRENSMNQSSNSLLANRKVWFGGGIAAIAAAVAVAFAMGGLPRNEDVNGTIVAAERYRAPQATTQDIQLGDMSVAQLLQNDSFLALVKNPDVQALMVEPGYEPAAKLIIDHPDIVRQGLAGQNFAEFNAALSTLRAHPAASQLLLSAPQADAVMLRNREASLSFLSPEMRSQAMANATAANSASADKMAKDAATSTSADSMSQNAASSTSADSMAQKAATSTSAGLSSAGSTSAGLNSAASTSAGLNAAGSTSAGLNSAASTSAGLNSAASTSAGLNSAGSASAGLNSAASTSAGLNSAASTSAGLSSAQNAASSTSAGLNAAKTSSGLSSADSRAAGLSSAQSAASSTAASKAAQSSAQNAANSSAYK